MAQIYNSEIGAEITANRFTDLIAYEPDVEKWPFAVEVAGRKLYSTSAYNVTVADERFMRFKTIRDAKAMAEAINRRYGFDCKVVVVEG